MHEIDPRYDERLDDVRRQLLDGYELGRRAVDAEEMRHGRGRIRYAPMSARALGFDARGDLRVEVSASDWVGAARPSRGAFLISEIGAAAFVRDTWPMLATTSRSRWSIDFESPVVMALYWHGLRFLDLGDRFGTFEARGTTGAVFEGPWERERLQPGTYTALWCGREVRVTCEQTAHRGVSGREVVFTSSPILDALSNFTLTDCL